MNLTVSKINLKISLLGISNNEESALIQTLDSDEKKMLWNWSGLTIQNKKLLSHLFKKIKFPCDFFLHGVTFHDTTLTCESYICMPDFLIDVTSIAECISSKGVNPYKFLIHLFHYEPMSLSLLIGSTINDIFDELMVNPELTFDDRIQAAFYKSPLSFCLLSEDQVIEFFNVCKNHFGNLQKAYSAHLKGWKEKSESYSLEPAFYSVEYGIQGRLDALFTEVSGQKIILELKSGKPYKVNEHGINFNHSAQVMMYTMMMNCINKLYSNKSYLLYSSLYDDALKYSPFDTKLQSDIIYARNSILFIQLSLSKHDQDQKHFLDLLHEGIYSNAESFTKQKAQEFIHIYKNQRATTKEYTKRIISFIALEQLNTKLGKSNANGNLGLSALWLLSDNEKSDLYSIIQELTIEDILFEESEFPILILKNNNSQLHNFRIGDTLVLYENLNVKNAVLHQQVYKSTLINIIEDKYFVRLRSRIFSDIEKHVNKTWNLEHDLLDKSFIYAYQNIFHFMKSSDANQDLWLGVIPPRIPLTTHNVNYTNIDHEFNHIISLLVNARDYFLLWGPPGTGKTSVIVKYTTRYLVESLHENVLLLAYTNRAVDEMCDALCSHGEEWIESFVRIGSRYAIKPEYADNLFDTQIRKLKNRKEIKQFLDSKKIICATIASILGKKELFQLKQFDTVIIDEASQILEPQLIGLLGQFKRIIFIGDHLQLPAVSLQSEEEANINSEELKTIGISNFNQSLFERLYLRCKNQGWSHGYAILNRQGRMNPEIMAFPSKMFYENKLELLPSLNKSSQLFDQFKITHHVNHALVSNRMIFISSTTSNSETIPDYKTNKIEAHLICKIVSQLNILYTQNNIEWTTDSCGVITPFRAQISNIVKELKENKLDHLALTIDTVERYQGGARDIIILSTCITNSELLDQISSLNHEGLDRKLNVAVTRTRELFILVGNKEALSMNENYRKLIASCIEISLEDEDHNG